MDKSNLVSAEFAEDAGHAKPTRRGLLVGAATALAAAAIPTALADSGKSKAGAWAQAAVDISPDSPIRRYMSASALLQDGRILITGGFDRPWSETKPLRALSSVWILDPSSGETTAVESMNLARARHAAVSLRDGRIAVVGGIDRVPLASIEIYDPRTNQWQIGASMTHARYDHSVVTDGVNIVVIGGSARNLVTSVEMLEVTGNLAAAPV